MPDGSAIGEAVLEVIAPDAAPRPIRISQSPFLIGRGGTGNHLQLSDSRISTGLMPDWGLNLSRLSV